MNDFSLLAVVNNYPAPSQTFISRKLAGLREAGVEVSVAATGFTKAVADEHMKLIQLAPWQQRSSSLDAVGRAGWGNLARGLRSTLGRDSKADGMRERISLAPFAGTTADIVHFEFSGIAVSYRHVLDQLRPAKLAVSCRGAAEQITPLFDPTRAPALAEVFGTVDLIHCVSDDMARTVVGLGAPPHKVLVNRPAIPVADFAPLAERRVGHDGPLRVLSVGRLHWKKGLDDGLRAVARVAEAQEVVYRIAGEGPEREKLTFLIDSLGLGPQTELLGTRTQAEVRDLLVWADVLLLPSLSEGISNAVLEAMASGLAVVATRCGGMDEAITPGLDGLLVDIGDIESMARSLAELADADRRDRIGQAAADRAAADFDIERQIAIFIDAYRILLTEPSAGR